MSKCEQDKIGRKEVVEKICTLVDNLAKEAYFCTALDGQWGSGKSFVLEMIEETLSQHDEYVIIKYDAWENSFYEDPLIAILSCIIDSMQKKLSEIKGYTEAIKAAGKEVIKEFVNSNPKAGALLGIVKSIANIVKKFNNPFSKDTSNSAVANFKSYQTLLAEVKGSLSKILKANEYYDKQSKLIILVDELDRCLPNEQLKILERLHHLFDVSNCAVIVALNMDSVAANVNTTFGVDGNEYLKKFFDFKYKLNTSANEYLKSLFNDFIEKLGKINNDTNCNDTVTNSFLCLEYGDKKVLQEIDNRQITRYFDSLLNACNDFGWEKLNPEILFFLIIGLYIRKNISSSFLTEYEIINNQRELSWQKDNIDLDYFDREMPYYDYLNLYIGIDRKDLPFEINKIYGQASFLAERSWNFNEIVVNSLGKKLNFRNIPIYRKPVVDSTICQRLRQLIMLYGGGI